jgi:hypothetical protein
MFVWGALSHMALGLGEAGIRQFADDAPVAAALQANIKEAGFYFFPGMEERPGMTKEQKAEAQKKWGEKYAAGPRGILIYHPDGQQPISPKQLLLQLGSGVIASLVLALALSQFGGLRSYACRVGTVTMLGVLPFLMVDFPYWNWYGFPTTYTAAQFVDRLVSFLVAALILAAIIKPTEAKQAASEPERAASTAKG